MMLWTSSFPCSLYMWWFAFPQGCTRLSQTSRRGTYFVLYRADIGGQDESDEANEHSFPLRCFRPYAQSVLYERLLLEVEHFLQLVPHPIVALCFRGLRTKYLALLKSHPEEKMSWRHSTGGARKRFCPRWNLFLSLTISQCLFEYVSLLSSPSVYCLVEA